MDKQNSMDILHASQEYYCDLQATCQHSIDTVPFECIQQQHSLDTVPFEWQHSLDTVPFEWQPWYCTF